MGWRLRRRLLAQFVNDNAALAPTSPGTMNSLALSSNLQAARRSENAATSVRALMAAVEERGRGANDRIDGQWGVSQAFDDPLHSLRLSAGYLQDLNGGVLLMSGEPIEEPGGLRAAASLLMSAHGAAQAASATRPGRCCKSGAHGDFAPVHCYHGPIRLPPS